MYLFTAATTTKTKMTAKTTTTTMSSYSLLLVRNGNTKDINGQSFLK